MNNPFRYRPSAQMAAMAWEVVKAISADPALHNAFSSGKMLGLLRHSHGWAIAYSGKRVASLEGIFLPASVFRTGIPGAAAAGTAAGFAVPAVSAVAGVAATSVVTGGVPTPGVAGTAIAGTDSAETGRAGAVFMHFVPPIYDITVGPFKEKEAEISHLNFLIAQAQTQAIAAAAAAAATATGGPAASAATAATAASAISPEEIEQMKLRRSLESIKLQKWTFEQYSVLNARGERKSVLDIFAEKGILPPAATGDCAAPKLLQFAYLNDLEPLEIGEFWYGAPPVGSVRAQGRFYPACSWKCGPLLQYMLQGQDVASAVACHGTPSVLYEDDSLVVVNKPSGMPAVPGLDGLESLESWLRQRPAHPVAATSDGAVGDASDGAVGDAAAGATSAAAVGDVVATTPSSSAAVGASGASEVFASAEQTEEIFQVHRLDQDTSGLMVFAKTRRAQSALQRQFQDHTVVKAYIAVLSAPGTVAPEATAAGSIPGTAPETAAPGTAAPGTVAGTTYRPASETTTAGAANRPASETTAAGAANRTAAGNIPGTDATGTSHGATGTIDFPLGPDYEDKPRQKHDPTQGKPAVTQYRFLTGPDATRALSLFGPSSSVSEYAPVLFLPQTGRSHQLRVHSAHALGLGAPILGDTLYGGDTLRGSTNSCGGTLLGDTLYGGDTLRGSTNSCGGTLLGDTLYGGDTLRGSTNSCGGTLRDNTLYGSDTLCGDTLPQLSTAQPASGSSPKAGSPSIIPQRLCLHASYLSFTHPLTGETLHFGWLPTHTK